MARRPATPAGAKGCITRATLVLAGALGAVAGAPTGAQEKTADVPYVEQGHARHVLDIYTPASPASRSGFTEVAGRSATSRTSRSSRRC
jgi:hypothetical protein